MAKAAIWMRTLTAHRGCKGWIWVTGEGDDAIHTCDKCGEQWGPITPGPDPAIFAGVQCYENGLDWSRPIDAFPIKAKS